MSLSALPPHIQALLARIRAGERNIRFSDQQYGAFDADAARGLNQANYADLTMPPRVSDILLHRSSPTVSWQQIRQLWLGLLKDAVAGPALESWYQKVGRELTLASGQAVDLVQLIHKVFAEQNTDIVLSGLSERDSSVLRRNQAASLAFLLEESASRETQLQRWRRHWRSIQVGNIVRKTLRQRAAGKASRQQDMTDSLIELLPELGIGRAVDSVVMALTAVNGPPGAAAACLLYECQQQSDWFEKVCEELQQITVHQICADPLRQAPLSRRFIKEVLRLWNVPMLVRQVRTDLEWQGEQIQKDSVLMFSPFFVHRNPEYWPQPDEFNPERWLADSPHASQCPHTYVPFGWAPKSCVGAMLGSTQLLLLLHLFATRFQWKLLEPDRLDITMTALPQPVAFDVELMVRTSASGQLTRPDILSQGPLCPFSETKLEEEQS
ncbi:cytochrome P450 [Shewanella submarina]|uniref:Cytochrome P450 n=1 Tax=Shewanella submarina TaxID=2016376 RepID=A0ABV7GII7_9GAMM|nr:cytochrome P450 [Shewanella submarina]MCL1035691.1 cytochrome P450 [Shewanella submarina]